MSERMDKPPSQDSKDPAPRKWWEKQRWIIAIAVVLLALAVFAITMFLRDDSPTTDAAADSDPSAEPSDPDATQPAGQGAPDPSATDPSADQSAPGGGQGDGEAGEQQQEDDRRTAQVCEQIIAFQESLQSGSIEPLTVVAELAEIERDARGTRLADRVNVAGATLQDFLTGQADANEVLEAGTELASAC